MSSIDLQVVVTRQGGCNSPLPSSCSSACSLWTTKHGLCVLVMPNYALFLEKFSVVCISCSVDMSPLLPLATEGMFLNLLHSLAPSCSTPKQGWVAALTCQLHQEPSHSPLSFSFRPTCWSSGLKPLHLLFFKLLSLLKSLLKTNVYF